MGGLVHHEPCKADGVFHVTDARYGAGTRMDYGQTEPEALAHAIADGLKRPVLYRDVETDGARRAAAVIARLV